ncbi:MAG: phage tail length tape measure family protein [Dokdonella sp.]
MADLQLSLRLTADGSGLSGTLRTASGELRDFSTQANTVEKSANAAGASVSRMGTQFDAAAGSGRGVVDVLGQLIGKIDPTVAKLGQLDVMQQRLADFKKSGALSGDDYAAYSQKINVARDALTSAGGAAHGFSLNSAAAKREVGVLAAEMSRGDFSNFQGSLLTLANRTGALSSIFSVAGISILAIVAAIGIFVGAALAGSNETDRLNASVIATGGYAGLTGSAVQDMARKIGDSTGHIGEARAALATLVDGGKITGDNLRIAGQAAVDFATTTGKSIEDAAKAVEKIADGPTHAVHDLDEQYHFLTLSTYEHIRALEQQGNTTDAATVAYKAFGDAFADRSKQVEENLGTLQRGWMSLKKTAGEAWDAMLNVGRSESVDSLKAQMAVAEQALTVAQANASTPRKFGVGFLDNLAIADNDSRVAFAAKQAEEIGAKLESALAKGAKSAGDAISQQGAAEAIAASDRIDKLSTSLDKAKQKQLALNEAAADLYKINSSGGKLPAGVNFDGPIADQPQGPGWQKIQDEITAKYGDHGKAAREAAQADRDAARDALELSNAWKTGQNMLDGLEGSLSATAKAQADFDIGTRNIAAAMNAIAIAGGDVDQVITLWQQLDAALGAQLAKTNDEIAARSKLPMGNAAVAAQLQQERDKLSGLTAATLAYDRAVVQATKDAQADTKAGIAQGTVAANLAQRMSELADLRDASNANSLIDQFGKPSEWDDLVKRIGDIGDALAKACDTKTIDGLNRALGETRQKMLSGIVDSSIQGLHSLQSMTTDGSKAFKVLQIAIDAATLANAVGIIVNQGFGDPYTAFARMAAMAAAVVALGVDIGGLSGSGPSAQSAEVRQKNQGAGSVLGDASAQSESIAKATDITANATQQLVGLNRGMLTALQALQNALGAAGNQLARGAANVPFAGPQDHTINIAGPGSSDPIGGMLGSFLFGGSQEIIDKGIVIAGGSLNDMLNKIVVGAYQTIQTDGGLFGSDSTSDQLVDVSDQFSKQFQLVISSIADTVRQGALALGLLPADVDAAMAAYHVEEQRISLEGLSADDQQKALEAVFSKLFDGLAGAVVPFIGQFQKVGEGLGETLVRIATEVQVAQQAFKQLGLSVNETDPEKFAQISDALVTAVGGLDAFITGMNSFTANFAPQSHQFEVASDALSSAFDQVGLTVPTTRDEMWKLMASLDATTASGREQIATLLRLADVSGKYYDGLEARAKAASDYTKLISGLGNEGAGASSISAFQSGRIEIEQWAEQTIDQAQALARAAGLQGASEHDLLLVRQIAARKVAELIIALRKETTSLEQQLGYIYGKDSPNYQAANDAAANFQDQATSAMEAVREANRQLYEDQLAGIKTIQDYLKSMEFGDLSGLTPEQQLEEARRQLLATQQSALGGNAQSMQQLPQMAQQFLALLRGSQASGADFNAGYDWVRQLLQSVVAQGPTADAPGQGTPITQEYINGRDSTLAAQDEINRQALASQLVQHLHDLSEALKIPVLELANTMHVPLAQLAQDLGIDLTHITGASVTALANMATQLGVPLGQLVEGLGLHLPELAAGVRELAAGLGIDLTALTANTASSLAGLAGQLGTNLTTLTASLGIDLGRLTDVNSPIFVALGSTIDALSPDIKTELEPLLDAVRGASGDEAKNLAVKALRDHVDSMAPAIKEQLAPFFDDITAPGNLSQLDYLRGVSGDTTSMSNSLSAAVTLLGDIKALLSGTGHGGNGSNSNTPSYAVGTPFVAGDQFANIHNGEMVIDRGSADALRRYGIRVASASNDDDSVAAELRALRAEVAKLRIENTAAVKENTATIRAEGDKANSKRDEVGRKVAGAMGGSQRSNYG